MPLSEWHKRDLLALFIQPWFRQASWSVILIQASPRSKMLAMAFVAPISSDMEGILEMELPYAICWMPNAEGTNTSPDVPSVVKLGQL